MQKAKYEIIYDVVSNLNSKCHSLTTVSTRVMVRPVLQKPDILAKSLGLEYSLTPSRPGNTDSGDFESETQRSPLPLSCLSPSFLCGNFPPEFHHNRARGSTALPRDRELTLRYLPRQHTNCTLVLNLSQLPITPCCLAAPSLMLGIHRGQKWEESQMQKKDT